VINTYPNEHLPFISGFKIDPINSRFVTYGKNSVDVWDFSNGLLSLIKHKFNDNSNSIVSAQLASNQAATSGNKNYILIV
jgi:hypothetical protein